jgi:acetoin utilization deacetylase AcuC-like enzyme
VTLDRRADVLTVSIHGDPHFAYPHFAGFADETGAGEGEGYNLNLPLPETCTVERYHKTLAKALRRVREFRPHYLVLALGLDTAKADPTGTWALRGADFRANGALIGALDVPTLIVQEGGYQIDHLGEMAVRFLQQFACS